MKDRKFILYIVIIVFIASLGTLTYRVGSSIKAKKDAIKALCFRWDGKTKQRYRQRNYLALQFKNSREFQNSLSWHIDVINYYIAKNITKE